MQIWVPSSERSETRNGIADPKACRHAHPEQTTKVPALADAMFRLIQRSEDGLTRARNSAPASVNATARVVRERSRTPRSVSSSAMIRETWDCERPHSRAAAEKLPSLATRA